MLVEEVNETLLCARTFICNRFLVFASREELDGWEARDFVSVCNVFLTVGIDLCNNALQRRLIISSQSLQYIILCDLHFLRLHSQCRLSRR